MFGNGLEREVIITVLPRVVMESPSMFSLGGMREFDYERLKVWADKGFCSRFGKIPGVLKVETDGVENRYIFYIDPRYNLKWVMAEIEAVAKTDEPEQEKPAHAASDEQLGGFLMPRNIFGYMMTDDVITPKKSKKAGKKRKK